MRLRLAVVQHDRRPVAAERVGVLPQLTGFQVQRPDVVDVAVPGDFGLERHRRIRPRGREHDRVVVDELRRRLVLRPERELGLRLRRQIELEQLLVPAHARAVEDVGAVGRVHRPGVAEGVVGEVDDFLRLEVDRVDVADAAAQRRERDRLAVVRERRRLGLVHRLHRQLQLDLLGQHVLDDQRSLLLGPHEVGEAIALGRPRHPRHLEPLAHLHDVIEAHVLVEAARQVAHERAVLGGQEHQIELAILAVDGHRRDQIAGRRRRNRERLGEMRLLLVRREVASVVGRALLVAERLEAILQVALEALVELVPLHLQRFFVRVFAAADDALAEREHELPDAFLPELRLDELEHGVTQVVDQARVARVAVAFHLRHLRHDVGDRRVAHGHQVGRRPLPALVVRQSLVHPQRHAAADQRLRDDVELELVRELVDDEAVEAVGGIVDRQHHPVADRLGERADAFRRGIGRRDVLLLELAVGLEQDHLDLEGQVVLQVRADLLVGALRVAGDAFEVRLDLGVVVNLEMVGGVDLPLELVVVDVVLAEVRHHRRLRGHGGRAPGGDHRDGCHQNQRCGERQRLARVHRQSTSERVSNPVAILQLTATACKRRAGLLFQ